MISASGPVPARCACGLSNGWASATMTSAASTVRSRISHHGVRAGVSSRGVSPSSSRIAGKAMRRGAGGVTRNSHQITGSAASAANSHGEAKASEPSASIRAHAHDAWRRCRQAPTPTLPRKRGREGPAASAVGGWGLTRRAWQPYRRRSADSAACNASKARCGGRSVRWKPRLQPTVRAIAASPSRWRRYRKA